MKILLFGDNHFSTTSSIIRGRGEKYSLRLENQIQSLNWVEETAKNNNCKMIICLGDFFDKSTLTDEELTALKEIKWNESLPHYFIVGNHESSVNGLAYNSTKALERENFYIIDKPSDLKIDNTYIHLLPYIIESDRKPLNEYFNFDKNFKNIVLSHNDIYGLQMGKFKSQTGFDINEIDSLCDLYINGHIHNGGNFSKHGYNLGNLTGQNFSEEAFVYKHCIAILDTETLQLEFFENPYAFNFYKITVLNEFEMNTLANLLTWTTANHNSIIAFKINEEYLNNVKNIIKQKSNILTYKITINKIVTELNTIDNLSINHLDKFIEFCKEKINNTDILEQELQKVCE